MRQRLAAVTGRIDVGTFEYLLDLVTDQWNVLRTFAIRDGSEQADKSPLANRIAFLVINFNADIVEKCRPMDS